MGDTLDSRIAIAVSDGATEPLKRINSAMRNVGKSGKEAGKEASEGLQKVGKSAQSAAEFTKSFAASISRIPLSYAAAGAAAAAFTVDAVKTGAAAQRSMERFTFGANASRAQVASLGSDMKKLALVTGESQAELTDQFSHFAQASGMAFEPAKALFTKITLASKVTGSTIGTLSEAVSTAGKNMNLSQHDMSGLLDDLINLPSTISQALAASLPQLSTMMENLGMSGGAATKQAMQTAAGLSKILGDSTRGGPELTKILGELNNAPLGRGVLAESGKDIFKLFQNLVPIIKQFNVEKGNVFQLNAFKQATGLDRQDAMAILKFYAMIQQARKIAKDENISLENALKKMTTVAKDQMSALQSLSGAWQNLLVAFDNFEVPQGIKDFADFLNQIAKDADAISKMPTLLKNPLATSGKVSKDIANEAHQYAHGHFLRTPTPAEKKAMEAGPLGWRNWAPTWMGGTPDTPHRAAGGPVTSGQPYIVGERGPELFTPSSSGSIVAAGTAAGMRPRHDAAEEENTKALERLNATLEYGDFDNPFHGGASPASGGGGGTPSFGGGRSGTPHSYGGGASPEGGHFSGPLPPAGHVNKSMSARAQRLMHRLISVHGWTPAAAALAAGEAEQESGIRPFTGNMNHEGGGGMFQWRLGRFRDMLNYRRQHPKLDAFDAETDYFAQDVSKYKLARHWPQIKNLDEGGRIGWDYERYGDNSTGRRVSNAYRWLRTLHNNVDAAKPSGLHPEHQSMLDSYKRLQSEIEKHPIRMSVLEPKIPNQLGAVARRIAQRRTRQSSQDTLAYMRFSSNADFFA